MDNTIDSKKFKIKDYVSIFIIVMFIPALLLSTLYIHQNVQKKMPLTAQEIQQLKGYINSDSYQQCYSNDLEKLNYLSNKLNSKNGEATFLSDYDSVKVYNFYLNCEKTLQNKEINDLKDMQSADLIKLQKQSLNN